MSGILSFSCKSPKYRCHRTKPRADSFSIYIVIATGFFAFAGYDKFWDSMGFTYVSFMHSTPFQTSGLNWTSRLNGHITHRCLLMASSTFYLE